MNEVCESNKNLRSQQDDNETPQRSLSRNHLHEDQHNDESYSGMTELSKLNSRSNHRVDLIY